MAQFVDQARITVQAGRGGDGASHFRREKFVPHGGPDGGNGGNGGNVILIVEPNLNTLLDYHYNAHFAAGDGRPGEGGERTGGNGDDVFLKVPPGTLVYDDATDRLLADLDDPDAVFVAARGGQGGLGNTAFKSATHRAPTLREKGEPGERATLRLELKLLADAALVGFPNAGKSTLIARLSAARPKIAGYPFTTLTPNLGVVQVDTGASFVLADLPGLIEGAAEGRGLGHEFLRHLERARVIVHVLDIAGYERPDPVSDYHAIRQELAAYDEHLAALPELVVANKIDLPDGPDMADIVAEELAPHGVETLYRVSAVTGAGLPELRRALAEAVLTSTVDSVVARRAQRQGAALPAMDEAPDDGFTVVEADDGTFVVEGREVERLMAITDLDNEEALMRLHRTLVRLGVIEALRHAGCSEGDDVRIGEVVLEFQE